MITNIDFSAVGPFRVDVKGPTDDDFDNDVVDKNGELLCEVFHPEVAAHIVECLNDRWRRDTASQAARLSRVPSEPVVASLEEQFDGTARGILHHWEVPPVKEQK